MLDKIIAVTEGKKLLRSFTYHMDGQIASVTRSVRRPGGLMIHRNGTEFTCKPLIGDLGYTFLFRNYRAEQGKRQTADPMGYPDGWNNLAYVNNSVTMTIDWLGGETHHWQTELTVTEKNATYAWGGFEVNFDPDTLTYVANLYWRAVFTKTYTGLGVCYCSYCPGGGAHWVSESVTMSGEALGNNPHFLSFHATVELTPEEYAEKKIMWEQELKSDIEGAVEEWLGRPIPGDPPDTKIYYGSCVCPE